MGKVHIPGERIPSPIFFSLCEAVIQISICILVIFVKLLYDLHIINVKYDHTLYSRHGI